MLKFEVYIPGGFPSNDELISDDLMKTCACVQGSKWEAIGSLLIDLDALEEIREITRDNTLRMMKVLKGWQLKTERATVGRLLKWFEQVGINERAIKMKYSELYC